MLELTDFLHPDLGAKCLKLFRDASFDESIFEALCILEAKMQNEFNTKAFGIDLVNYVFDNKLLVVSANETRNKNLKCMFEGAFNLIRNDRGHRNSKTMKIDIECKNPKECLMYLGFLSLLFSYLDKNLRFAPEIESINPERFEIIGKNFTEESKVIVNGKPAKILQSSNDVILIDIGEISEGHIQVYSKNLKSNIKHFKIHKSQSETVQEIMSIKIPLYSDKEGKNKIEFIDGMILKMHELSGHSYLMISPCYPDNNYKVGDYIIHGHSGYKLDTRVGKTWFRDPADKKIKIAWDGSMVCVATTVGSKKKMKPTGIALQPISPKLGKDERRRIAVLATYTDGVVTKIIDVTDKSKILISNTDVAALDKKDKAILIAKDFGTSNLTCIHSGIHTACDIEVVSPISMDKYQIFNGGLGDLQLSRYQEIAIDSDNNLYFGNQSNNMYCLSLSGATLKKFISLPSSSQDCLENSASSIRHVGHPCLDEARGYMYFSTLRPRAVYKMKLTTGKIDKIYESQRMIPKSIAMDSSGNLYFATMNKIIIKISPSNEIMELPIGIDSINLALIDDKNIIVSSSGGGKVIGIYSTESGKEIKTFDFPKERTVSNGLCVFGNDVYASGFDNGLIMRLDLKKEKHEVVAEGLHTIGGTAFDKDGNLYVSIFSSRNAQEGGIYKIYGVGKNL